VSLPEVNTPGARNIKICWSIALATTRDISLFVYFSKIAQSMKCVSGSLSSHHHPTSKTQRIPILVQEDPDTRILTIPTRLLTHWYCEDPGVRKTRVSAYNPACILLFCKPKNVCLYNDDIMISSCTCHRRWRQDIGSMLRPIFVCR